MRGGRNRMRARSVFRLVFVVGFVLGALWLRPGERSSAAPARGFPFQDPRLSMRARIDDLVARLTLGEKISLLHQFQPAIPRLAIPVFKTGTEALHGVAWTTDRDNNGAVVTAAGTVFPQAIGLASTWDPALIRQVGAAVGDEARGYNVLAPR